MEATSRTMIKVMVINMHAMSFPSFVPSPLRLTPLEESIDSCFNGTLYVSVPITVMKYLDQKSDDELVAMTSQMTTNIYYQMIETLKPKRVRHLR
jgi:hypothetical protein